MPLRNLSDVAGNHRSMGPGLAFCPMAPQPDEPNLFYFPGFRKIKSSLIPVWTYINSILDGSLFLFGRYADTITAISFWAYQTHHARFVSATTGIPDSRGLGRQAGG